VLAIPKRFALGGIASLTERPSKNMAERSEAKTPGAGFPHPKGQAGRRWRGGDHAIGERRSRERPTERYVKYPPQRSEATSDDGRRTTVRRGLFGITSSWTPSGGSILDRASAHLRRTLAEMTKANPWISA
jgi:hypothetical protein